MTGERVVLPEDIRRIAESPAGQRSKERIAARWSKRTRAAYARQDAALQKEQERHAARVRALRNKLDAELEAAREEAHDAERAFFNAKLAASGDRS